MRGRKKADSLASRGLCKCFLGIYAPCDNEPGEMMSLSTCDALWRLKIIILLPSASIFTVATEIFFFRYGTLLKDMGLESRENYESITNNDLEIFPGRASDFLHLDEAL